METYFGKSDIAKFQNSFIYEFGIFDIHILEIMKLDSEDKNTNSLNINSIIWKINRMR